MKPFHEGVCQGVFLCRLSLSPLLLIRLMVFMMVFIIIRLYIYGFAVGLVLLVSSIIYRSALQSFIDESGISSPFGPLLLVVLSERTRSSLC